MRMLIVQWHHEDSPTDAERARNEQIAMLEEKRNPFIDQPSLVAAPPIPSAGPPSPAPSTAAGGTVRSNTARKVYHRPDCPGYNTIAAHHRVEFASETDARAAGYRMARNCP